MTEDIKGLIEKINQEGIKSAEEKARKIESEAIRQAEEIVARAKKDAQKTVRIGYKINSDLIELEIIDPGAGFDIKLDLSGLDPLRTRGRGIILIRSTMDVVSYNQAGNRIIMVKYWHGRKEAKK